MPPTAELQFTDLEDASLRWKRYLKLVFAIECGTIETKRNGGIGFSVIVRILGVQLFHQFGLGDSTVSSLAGNEDTSVAINAESSPLIIRPHTFQMHTPVANTTNFADNSSNITHSHDHEF